MINAAVIALLLNKNASDWLAQAIIVPLAKRWPSWNFAPCHALPLGFSRSLNCGIWGRDQETRRDCSCPFDLQESQLFTLATTFKIQANKQGG
jgi:hypothetical protein